MTNNKRKGQAPPRYDEAFKVGAIRLVTEQNRPCKDAAEELGICIDTLKNWLKAAGHATNRAHPSTGNPSRVRELEAENRALKKALAEKEETIDVLKKSVLTSIKILLCYSLFQLKLTSVVWGYIALPK